MSNLLSDPGFELYDDGSWVKAYGAAYAPGDGRDNSAAFHLKAEPFVLNKAYITQQVTGVTTGQRLAFSFWARSTDDGAAEDLTVWLDQGDGNFAQVDTIPWETWGKSWSRYCYQFTSLGSTLRVHVEHDDAVGGDTDGWFVDDFALQAPGRTTRTFRDAILADLQDVTVANGFDTTVVQVTTEPRPKQHLSLPAIELTTGEGGSTEDPEEIGAGDGTTEQEYALTLHVGESDPHDAISDMLDDVRNAIERRDENSNLCAIPGFMYATVTNWTRPAVPEDTRRNQLTIEATVRVRYIYSRGAV